MAKKPGKSGTGRVHIISDEIPPTRSPISGKIYTSSTRLREEYKAHGAEEIGTAYDNGYTPERERNPDKISEKLNRNISERFREELNRGK